jgi:hypothetical protein
MFDRSALNFHGEQLLDVNLIKLQLSGWLQKIRAGEWQFCIGRQSLFHQNH